MRTVGVGAQKLGTENLEEIKKANTSLKSANTKLKNEIEKLKTENAELIWNRNKREEGTVNVTVS